MGRLSRKRAPGIVEVAARAGVSPATVSRTFNEPGLVRAQTRHRIELAASELGYIRDRMAGTLHNRFSGTVGLVVPTIDNAIFAELIQAFAARLRDHDRTMLIATHGYDLSLEMAIVRSLLERRIVGVVLVGVDHEELPLSILAQRGVPVISVWNYRANSRIPCIGADNYQAGAFVARHVLDLGHRDVAFMFPGVQSNDRARDRMNGALDQAASMGMRVPPERVLTCPYDIGIAKDLAKDLMSLGPPTAIVCGNDVIAQGVVYACYALGIKVPDDISIIGIGDFSGSAHLEPGLTTLRLPARRIGRKAADAIVELSESGRTTEELDNPVDFSFLQRGSTAPPKQ